jgi:hypothetical protein
MSSPRGRLRVTDAHFEFFNDRIRRAHLRDDQASARNLTAEALNSRSSQSTEPAASEETLIRRVLLDIGRFPLFR